MTGTSLSGPKTLLFTLNIRDVMTGTSLSGPKVLLFTLKH